MVTIRAHYRVEIPTERSPFSVKNSALANAVDSNNIDAVKYWLENLLGGEPSFLDVLWDNSPLICVAAKKGYSEIADLLIAHDRVLANEKHIPKRDHCYGEALNWAVSEGHTEIVHSLCVALDSVDFRDAKGNTALMTAVSAGDRLLVNQLLFYGADINAISIDGDTPLTIAVLRQDLEMVHALLGHGTANDDSSVHLDSAGLGGLNAMELAVVLRAAQEKKAAGRADGIQAQPIEVAEQIIHALRFYGFAEAEGSAGEICEVASLRISEGKLDVATGLLLDELNARGVVGDVVPYKANISHAQIEHDDIRHLRSQYLRRLVRELQID